MTTNVKPTETNPFADFDSIYSYSRKQAIEDGTLQDVTATARQAGFKFPVATTSTVYDMIKDLPAKSHDSIEARLWDVLSMLRFYSGRGGSEILFKVTLPTSSTRQRLVTLKALCAPGDNLQPVITIMLPDED